MMKQTIFVLLLGTALLACNQGDEATRTAGGTGKLFYDYQVWADEDNPEATIRLQYRLGGADGDAVTLPPAMQVYLDDLPFVLDSSKFNGAYYELSRPLDKLEGKHVIRLMEKSRTVQEQAFSFATFSLAKELPETLAKKSYSLAINGGQAPGQFLRVVMLDTALQSVGVNEEVPVENGKITLQPSMFFHLTKGPVTLELSRSDEEPIAEGAEIKGRWLLNYSLRRQFELVD